MANKWPRCRAVSFLSPLSLLSLSLPEMRKCRQRKDENALEVEAEEVAAFRR